MKKREKKDTDHEISFLGKLFLGLKSFKAWLCGLHPIKRTVEKQRILAGASDADATVENKVSFVFLISRTVAIALLVLILVLSLIFGGRIISYENVYYMFKDIEYISSFSENAPATLSYSKPLTNQDFASFKNGLAIVGDSEFKFFTSSGRATMSVGGEYSNPKITTSKSYALVYDQGNRSFSVYNSFVCLYKETLESPISSAHMSEDGSFCIVTTSKGFGSKVRVYDNGFSLEAEYTKNDYVISAQMSQNGKYVAVASLSAENGVGKVTLDLMQRGKEDLKFSQTVTDAIPYSVAFLTKDRVALICDGGTYVFDLSGNRKTEYKFSDALTHMATGEKRIALVFGKNTVVLDENGMVIRSFTADCEIFDVKVYGDYVYLLCDREVRRYNTKSVVTEYDSVAFTEEDAGLVLLDDGKLLACTATVAYYISFN